MAKKAILMIQVQTRMRNLNYWIVILNVVRKFEILCKRIKYQLLMLTF